MTTEEPDLTPEGAVGPDDINQQEDLTPEGAVGPDDVQSSEPDEEEQAELDRRAAVVQEYEESNARMQAAQAEQPPVPVSDVVPPESEISEESEAPSEE